MRFQQEEERHKKAIENYQNFINKRINKAKLHNYMVKNRSSFKNIIHIQSGQYSYKSAPDRLLIKSNEKHTYTLNNKTVHERRK